MTTDELRSAYIAAYFALDSGLLPESEHQPVSNAMAALARLYPDNIGCRPGQDPDTMARIAVVLTRPR